MVDEDGYCTQCGTKAPRRPRPLRGAARAAGWPASATAASATPSTRTRMALAVDGRARVLVVCDGVSNTDQSESGPSPPPRRSLEVLRPPLPEGSGSRRARPPPSPGSSPRRRPPGRTGPCSRSRPTTPPTRRRARSWPRRWRTASCTTPARRLPHLPAARRRQRPDAHHRRLDGPGADRRGYAAGRGRGLQAGALDHQVAGQGQPRVVPRVGQAQVNGPGLAARVLRRAVELRLRAGRPSRADRGRRFERPACRRHPPGRVCERRRWAGQHHRDASATGGGPTRRRSSPRAQRAVSRPRP